MLDIYLVNDFMHVDIDCMTQTLFDFSKVWVKVIFIWVVCVRWVCIFVCMFELIVTINEKMLDWGWFLWGERIRTTHRPYLSFDMVLVYVLMNPNQAWNQLLIFLQLWYFEVSENH